MAEYIKREEAVKVAEKYGLTNGLAWGRHTGLAICIASEIAEISAADVASVVHGRWEPCFDEDNNWRRGFTKCSNCGKEYYASVVQHYNYCCFCGAKMDGDANG